MHKKSHRNGRRSGDGSSDSEDDMGVLQDPVRDAYMKSHQKDLKALRPSQLKFKNMPDLIQLNTSDYFNNDDDDPTKKGTYKYKVNSKVSIEPPTETKLDPKQQKEMEELANFAQAAGSVRSREWRGVAPPDGEDVSYIS